MSGLFSPNFSVLNEPRYLRSTIRTTMRCLSACLLTAMTLAGINVIIALSTLCLFNLYEFNCMRLARRLPSLLGIHSNTFFARTHGLLQYPFRTVVLAFEYGKGWSLASPPNRFHADTPSVRQNELFQLKFQTLDRKTFHQIVGDIRQQRFEQPGLV